MRPYVLFDAGGTLVFPDFKWLSKLLSDHGYDVNEEDIMRRFSEIGYSIDLGLRNGKNILEGEEFIHGYFGMLFKPFVNPEELSGLIGETKIRDREVHLWNRTFPWVVETLEDLKEKGYSMSVISNSDGRVAKALGDADLAKYMERIYDSHIVRSEKPDPMIFELALKELSLKPKEVIFVGDMFYIDVLGANRVGIPAVHLDPFNLYKDWPGLRVPKISSLPELLEKERINSEKLFPFD